MTKFHYGFAEISPRQASCAANGLTSEPGGEDCRGVICAADEAGQHGFEIPVTLISQKPIQQ